MKKFIYLAIIIATMASCKKGHYAATGSDADNQVTITDTAKEVGLPSAPVAVPEAGKFTPINFTIPDQKMKISLDGATLTVIYPEDVVLLTQKESLLQSYAVHFKEDFSASDLSQFDYRSMTKEGVNALNWVDDNLNNINTIQKDTVVNNIAIVKIEVARTFTFTHTFNTVDEATAEYNKLVADKSQSISFSAYYAPVDPNSVTVIGKAGIVYKP